MIHKRSRSASCETAFLLLKASVRFKTSPTLNTHLIAATITRTIYLRAVSR
jgi:hypothetical protein